MMNEHFDYRCTAVYGAKIECTDCGQSMNILNGQADNYYVIQVRNEPTDGKRPIK